MQTTSPLRWHALAPAAAALLALSCGGAQESTPPAPTTSTTVATPATAQTQPAQTQPATSDVTLAANQVNHVDVTFYYLPG